MLKHQNRSEFNNDYIKIENNEKKLKSSDLKSKRISKSKIKSKSKSKSKSKTSSVSSNNGDSDDSLQQELEKLNKFKMEMRDKMNKNKQSKDLLKSLKNSAGLKISHCSSTKSIQSSKKKKKAPPPASVIKPLQLSKL